MKNQLDTISKKLRFKDTEIGDVVLLKDRNYKKHNCHLAMVTQLQYTSDNEMRSAVVRLASGTQVVQPVEKLYFMELNEKDVHQQQRLLKSQPDSEQTGRRDSQSAVDSTQWSDDYDIVSASLEVKE